MTTPPRQQMGLQCLLVFAQAHEEFRIPEIQSIAELHGFEVTFPPFPDASRPFMVLELESESHARVLAQRCILVKSVCEFYGRGKTYEELHEQIRKNRERWSKYTHDTSFKFSISAYNHTIPQRRMKDVIEGFSYMDFRGRIDMHSPEVVLACLKNRDKRGTIRHKHEGDGDFEEVFFGRLIEEGTARPLVKTFDVKKRTYYGNTSMEAEISLLMANQTLAAPGKLIYDPFIGTGSMAYATHFGAFVFGSDIDGRQMRGKEKQPGIIRAAAQYGVASRILDLCTFDVTRNPWRCGEMFDAIITDPPYGVRAGAKRLGRKARPDKPPRANPQSHSSQTTLTTTVHTADHALRAISLVVDLVLLARYLLRPRGRLVFFLPTVTTSTKRSIYNHAVRGHGGRRELAANFGSWGRRLITIRKTTSERYPPPTFTSAADAPDDGLAHTPAHKDFREKYFQGSRNRGRGDAWA
ncbi:tRNA guanosine-2'-O-methyltransferase [Fomitopsis serialis]|uniref:tRNA guanosine-2'-O-methyltransferase n=1 Tax=Fomitopsis serialis TaxID=139415 RepID=UPI0020087EC7|nr:tRNA guanosine-2'-O-methyltransferase [Neoantrodia serialis]KAH9935695.1 tRNA guanosine-2'-O-methyltransferase [Neoantrodia serialis]